MSWPCQGSRPLTHRELSEPFPFRSGSDWAKAFFWPCVNVYERVIGVCKSYSCSFLILEANSWRLLSCKHILMRLANPPQPHAIHNKHADVLFCSGSWYHSISVCTAHPPPAFLCVCPFSISSIPLVRSNPATLDAVVTKLCVPGSQSV